MCWGQELPISQHSSLFSLIGTNYGGNGRTTFAVPDLRSRVVLGVGAGAGLTPRMIGQTGGQETVTLQLQQMPTHLHGHQCEASYSVTASVDKGSTTVPRNGAQLAASYNVTFDANVQWYNSSSANMVALAGVEAGPPTVSLATVGGGQAHENRQPFVAIHFVIALDGIFPPRS